VYECGVSGSTEKWLCQFPRNDLVVLLDIALHYFISRINWVNKTTSKIIIKTICDSVNHTHFPKEYHLPDWACQDNKGWSCRLASCNFLDKNEQEQCDIFTGPQFYAFSSSQEDRLRILSCKTWISYFCHQRAEYKRTWEKLTLLYMLNVSGWVAVLKEILY